MSWRGNDCTQPDGAQRGGASDPVYGRFESRLRFESMLTSPEAFFKLLAHHDRGWSRKPIIVEVEWSVGIDIDACGHKR